MISEKEGMISFGFMHRGTMKGSNERVNYICMNSRAWGFFGSVVGGQRKNRVCGTLISFSNLCVDIRKALSPKTVVPPLLRAVIKAT